VATWRRYASSICGCVAKSAYSRSWYSQNRPCSPAARAAAAMAGDCSVTRAKSRHSTRSTPSATYSASAGATSAS